MAGVQRPSFLKRQKEQKRLAKAAAKREKRNLNKLAKANAARGEDTAGFDPNTEPVEGAGEGEAAE